MKLIVITSPEFLPGETELMQAMLEEGLDRIHLRKPGCTAAELAALIERFPAPFRPRITLHDHFPLQRTYGLGGVHLNGRNPDLPDGYRGTVSRSCHSLEEVAAHRTATDYLFLSPVFDSISKQGYRSAFPPAALREAAAAGIIDEKVLALGGVSEANLPEVRGYGFGGAALPRRHLGTLPLAGRHRRDTPPLQTPAASRPLTRSRFFFHGIRICIPAAPPGHISLRRQPDPPPRTHRPRTRSVSPTCKPPLCNTTADLIASAENNPLPAPERRRQKSPARTPPALCFTPFPPFRSPHHTKKKPPTFSGGRQIRGRRRASLFSDGRLSRRPPFCPT